jgi:hypothetical protein
MMSRSGKMEWGCPWRRMLSWATNLLPGGERGCYG